MPARRARRRVRTRRRARTSVVTIANRPQQQVWDEISITMDSDFRPGSVAAAQVGAATFSLFTQRNAAWVSDAALEAEMVAAMRRAQTLSLAATLANGVFAADQFSMKGMPQAVDRIAGECGRDSVPPQAPDHSAAPDRSTACQRFPNLC